MNRIDNIITDMDRNGETDRRVNGIRVTRYKPTPIEKLRSWGYAKEIRKKLDREFNERIATEEERRKARQSWEQVKKMYS
jgi:hypothetical protein